MTFHSEFRIGQRVLIHLKDGRKIITQYTGKTSRSVNTKIGAFYNKEIRQISIYKGEPK